MSVFKWILWPFSALYGCLTWLRNLAFDWGLRPSYQSKLKTICIGNLQVGGSGKTPMTAYLFWLYASQYSIAVLSRGYGRKSKGLIAASELSTADDIGDEPLWYHQTLPGAKVVVSEKRKKGLKYIENRTHSELVLLDDALQHRKVTCHANLLLTDYQLLYTQDHVMPMGRLREWCTGAKRAQIIVVSKCPEDLSPESAQTIVKQLKPLPQQQVFFTCLSLGNPKKLKGALSLDKRPYQAVLALSGLANPKSFHAFCQRFSSNIQYKTFEDHHAYSIAELKALFNGLPDNTIVLCTEKDAVKLKEQHLLACIPENTVYVLPVFVNCLFDQEAQLKAAIDTCLNA